jgi:hypothetical protein
MFIRCRAEGSVYDYQPGFGLRLVKSAGDPKWADLRISDIDYSVFENVSKTIDDQFVSDPFYVPEAKR